MFCMPEMQDLDVCKKNNLSVGKFEDMMELLKQID